MYFFSSSICDAMLELERKWGMKYKYLTIFKKFPDTGHSELAKTGKKKKNYV